MVSNKLPVQGIKAVIFDWAGTVVDYGCFAPLAVFLEVFKKRGIEITHQEARDPMGMAKREHIQAICSMERVSKLWELKYGRRPCENDIDELYADFEPMLFEILPRYAEPIPGVLDVVESLRKKGIKIGSTTGYTSEMLGIVAKEADKRGYSPDSVVTSSDVPAGRPYPFMCYQNAINLQVYPLWAMVKVGDTISDIKEGINAGMWSVGVIDGGSELGLTAEEVRTLDNESQEKTGA